MMSKFLVMTNPCLDHIKTMCQVIMNMVIKWYRTPLRNMDMRHGAKRLISPAGILSFLLHSERA